MSQSQSEQVRLDPYKQAATTTDLSVQEKIKDLHAIIQAAQTGMLVTRDSDGSMHSRAMTPATPFNETQLTLVFLANNVSAKLKEIKNDEHVNVSFYDPSTTNWASYAGIARVTQDREVIKKHWSPCVSAYFGDLNDGVHKGDEHDPRVCAIEVFPNSIYYWVTKTSSIVRTVKVAASAVIGTPAPTGELRYISNDEIQLTHYLNTKDKDKK